MLGFQIDKQFGYFPKDAVEVDEVFVDEKKEIEMRTQVRTTEEHNRSGLLLFCLLPCCCVSCPYSLFRKQTSSVRMHSGL